MNFRSNENTNSSCSAYAYKTNTITFLKLSRGLKAIEVRKSFFFHSKENYNIKFKPF